MKKSVIIENLCVKNLLNSIKTNNKQRSILNDTFIKIRYTLLYSPKMFSWVLYVAYEDLYSYMYIIT